LAPNILINFLNLGISNDIVVRILGMVLIFYGYFYVRASRHKKEMASFYSWTIHTRVSAIVVLSIFAMLSLAHPVIVAFGAVDLLGAIWTLLELRKSGAVVKEQH
jgi:uncharacterized membrane protein HdeD (DUF308 family)